MQKVRNFSRRVRWPSGGELETGERTLGALPEPGTPSDLGYQAMSAILAAIEDAEDPLDRADVIEAYLANADAKGVLFASDG